MGSDSGNKDGHMAALDEGKTQLANEVVGMLGSTNPDEFFDVIMHSFDMVQLALLHPVIAYVHKIVERDIAQEASTCHTEALSDLLVKLNTLARYIDKKVQDRSN